MMPKVSVNMICYNEGRFLAEAIESVRSQTFEDWEMVIVDDGSDDESRDVLRDMENRDSRIRVFYQAHAGISAARNMCLRHSTGDYIALHDASDLSLPERFEQQVAHLNAHPEVSLLGSQMYWFRDDLSDAVQVRKYPESPESIALWYSRHIMGVPHATCMVRKGVFESVGGYDESLPRAVDLHLFMRLSGKIGMGVLPEALYAYRVAKLYSFAHFRLINHCRRYAVQCLRPSCPDLDWYEAYLERCRANRILYACHACVDAVRYARTRARFLIKGRD